MPRKSKTVDAWASRFSRALASPVTTVVPPGWFTKREWSEKLGMSHGHTSLLLRDGIAFGKIEARKFRLKTDSYCAFPVMHYRRK